ncbi:MAG: hypothetical protein K9J37_20935 [Saprospiraceae bacterium]|nr:hypothetical protein [Saprospiraceae bacterium]MCF8252386.1 hypothetical protein [Saprospiraceae bacterium]MCF8282256.1 hypothetical protein [Bacteroidales bacterium]MCF8313990.1 hypothetical protein [Saprospiraceae bacterium]MCF8442716.1 hypothetical protein [Saprospiraceae bacterium]
MKQTAFLFLSLFVLAACNQDKPAPPPQQTTPPPPAAAATLPSVPLDLLKDIFEQGTQVDYIFYNHPFTMSLTDKPSIQFAVRHIAEQPAPLKPECKAMGRVSYQIRGDIVLEGDFYFSTGCTYFVFEKNRVKTSANYMTDEGIKYFNEQIKNAMQMQQQAQQKANGQ